MTLTQRERKVDVEKLTNEQTDELSTQIGQKVREQVDETVNKINTLLKVYGMEAKMQIVLGKIGELDKIPKKRGRKPKQNIV